MLYGFVFTDVDNSDNQDMCSKFAGGQQQYYLRLTDSTNIIRFACSDNSDWAGVDSDNAVVADTWYHVVVVYNGVDTRMYLNNKLQAVTDFDSFNIFNGSQTIFCWAKGQGQIMGIFI